MVPGFENLQEKIAYVHLCSQSRRKSNIYHNFKLVLYRKRNYAIYINHRYLTKTEYQKIQTLTFFVSTKFRFCLTIFSSDRDAFRDSFQKVILIQAERKNAEVGHCLLKDFL